MGGSTTRYYTITNPQPRQLAANSGWLASDERNSQAWSPGNTFLRKAIWALCRWVIQEKADVLMGLWDGIESQCMCSLLGMGQQLSSRAIEMASRVNVMCKLLSLVSIWDQ